MRKYIVDYSIEVDAPRNGGKVRLPVSRTGNRDRKTREVEILIDGMATSSWILAKKLTRKHRPYSNDSIGAAR